MGSLVGLQAKDFPFLLVEIAAALITGYLAAMVAGNEAAATALGRVRLSQGAWDERRAWNRYFRTDVESSPWVRVSVKEGGDFLGWIEGISRPEEALPSISLRDPSLFVTGERWRATHLTRERF